MDKFIEAVKTAVRNGCKRCKCPICRYYINLKINGFTGGIQAMCEGCGMFWLEGEKYAK